MYYLNATITHTAAMGISISNIVPTGRLTCKEREKEEKVIMYHYVLAIKIGNIIFQLTVYSMYL